MPKVKAVFVTYNPLTSRPTVVDDKGRVWEKTQNGTWIQMELPDQPLRSPNVG